MGKERGEGLLAIGDVGVLILENDEGAFGGLLLAEDLAESFDEFCEFRVFAVEEARLKEVPFRWRGNVTLSIESKQDAIKK